MIKAIVFDLDDTLISEKEYIKSGFLHIANILHLEIKMSENLIFNDLISLFKISPINIFNRFYEKHGMEYSNMMIISLVNEYRNHYPKIQFYSDVLPCLHALRYAGMKLGIITDGYAKAQRQKLNAVEAEKYFDEIIVTDELGRDFWKPHPKAFELIREKLEINYEEMIYVGDNPEKDFYISNLYPITTVRVLRDGIHKHNDYFEGVKENYIINQMDDVAQLIQSLKN